MTPAQASGHPSLFDAPVQGPTDEGMRAADCWQAQNRLPKNPACVDCDGPIPQWTRDTLCPGNRLTNSGIGDPPQETKMFQHQVRYQGAPALGFSLGWVAAAGDPSVWEKLTPEQQAWVSSTLIKLDQRIRETTGTVCRTWGPAITAAGGCFQHWFNGAKLGFTKADGSPLVLRTDGVFDQDTLDALRTVAGINPTDFPTPFPTPAAPPPEEKKKLSKAAVAGIAIAGAAAVGGIVWAATRRR
jgi:hypothetical protein